MTFNRISKTLGSFGGAKAGILCAGVSAVMLSSLVAQTGDIDMEARKRSIPVLEGHIAERVERIEAITGDMKQVNARVEAQIEIFVKKLAAIKDSEDSRQRVSMMKTRAMKGLSRSAERYKTTRDAIIQKIREGNSEIPTEILRNDAKIFDEHIAKRVSQILEISKSFTQDQDVPKYEKVDGGNYYTPGLGWSDDVEQISEEWRQNRRDRVMDTKQQREIMEALEKSIEKQEDYVKAILARMKSNTLSEVDRRFMEGELKWRRQLLTARIDQYAEMSEVPQPNTHAISQEDALDLEHSIHDAAQDLRRDIDRLFFEYANLNRERAKVASLSKNLEARKKWLQEHSGK